MKPLPKTKLAPVLMRAIGFASGAPCPHSGQWLKSFDHDAHNGQGEAEFTADPALAMEFRTISDALEFWKRTSTVRPLRPDGRPNKPLTALSVTFDPGVVK